MTLTPEQQALQDSVAAVLAKRSDSAAVRRAVERPERYDVELWRVLCDQIGVAALAVPESSGGLGAGARDVQIVLEELGRSLTPSPMLASVLAGTLLVELDGDEAGARLLPRIAGGAVPAVAWADEDGCWGDGPFVARDGRLSGVAHYVLDGHDAEILLAVADGAVYEVDPAAALRTATPAMDVTRRLATVELDDTPGTRIGPADARPALMATLDAALVALAGEQVGTAARALRSTVEFTLARHQFGRPIGSFQALKHRMADLYVLLEAARSAAYAAADGSLPAAVAKAYCSEALTTIAGEAIQLHGGIAITWEHDAQLWFKRAHGSAALFATPAECLRRLEEELA